MVADIILKELGLTYVEPTEIKLVESLIMVHCTFDCFHLIVLISKQKKMKYLIVNHKILTTFYKYILLLASNLNLCAIKDALIILLGF